jgi:hypothetical protein
MNENVQWQMIKDSVLFALSSGFSVSFLFGKKINLFCISSFFSLHRSLYLLLASGLTKPGVVGDFFALVSMKLPNFCQKAKF